MAYNKELTLLEQQRAAAEKALAEVVAAQKQAREGERAARQAERETDYWTAYNARVTQQTVVMVAADNLKSEKKRLRELAHDEAVAKSRMPKPKREAQGAGTTDEKETVGYEA